MELRTQQQNNEHPYKTLAVYIADDALRHQPMEAGHMTVLGLQAYWIRILPCCYI